MNPQTTSVAWCAFLKKKNKTKHLVLSTEVVVPHSISSQIITFPEQFTGNREKLIGSFQGDRVLFSLSPL